MKWFFKKSDKNKEQVVIRGFNNRVIIVEHGVERPLYKNTTIRGLDIRIVGNNNTVKIEMPFNAAESSIIIKNDNVNIELGRSSCFFGVHIKCKYGNGQICKIGPDTTINGAEMELCEESGLVIGENCLLASNLKFWPSDAHSILDKDTMEILNLSNGPITIGNRVWVGESVIFTKRARIADDCVVAAGSVCCDDYAESNVVIAGNPGKIIRRNIVWNVNNPYLLKRKI